MVLKYLILLAFLFLGCSDPELDSPYDEKSPNYIGNVSSSSSAVPSSSSAVSSSSSAVQSSSSSVPSSSSVVSSSSSSVPSSSSEIPSSSSSVQSSSSIPSSSSSSLPSSSSSVCNQEGIVNGSPVSYGGETYETVVICNQTWLKRNLNVMHNSGNGNSVCYNNQESSCNTYGRLYNWAAAMDLPSSCNSSTCASQVSPKHQGICPPGWHIPSDADWTTLTNNIGGSSTAGTKLKSASGWNSYSGVPAGTDIYGFAALPGGYGDSAGGFSNAGNYGYWWSSSEYDASIAYTRYMYYYYEDVDRYYFSKTGLFSVRCLQDSAP
jgi:uncharacterized protein (TIGR02145 family)